VRITSLISVEGLARGWYWNANSDAVARIGRVEPRILRG
jgi:hypothetical protein